jgi:Fe2+ or Zn2+ uptake regulation protein
MDLKEIESILREHDMKPSLYRMKVYQYLVENRNHPNIETIYQELVKEIPTLSKTTLYNIMDLFLEKGVVTLITIDGNEMHYDADVSSHGHFRCSKCQTIYDTVIDPSSLRFKGMEDFKIHKGHVYFWGICPKCLAGRDS